MKKLITILTLLTFTWVQAKEYKEYQSLSGTAIVDNETLTTTAKDYSNGLFSTYPILEKEEIRGFDLINTYGLVMLQIPQSGNEEVVGTASVIATVDYEVARNGEVFSRQQQITLSVSTSEAGFKNVDYVRIKGALKMTVTINTATGVSNYSGIDLSVVCGGEHYAFLTPADKLSGLYYTAPVQRADGGYVDGNLYVAWTDVINGVEPEAYELEWTYISAPVEGASVLLREGVFRHNSSRVRVTNNSYFIPLVYEKGYIVYRVRAIGKNIVNGVLTDVKSAWSLEDNFTSLVGVPTEVTYWFNGLEENMNWNSSISFIEEGKNKAVVTYHDGTLKSRQAVTRVNSDQRAVVAETYYDHNGRPVIQTLPVPVIGTEENNFDYRPSFNVVDVQKGKIEKSDFDPATSGICGPTAPQFSKAKGASNYYSGDNSLGQNGNTGQNILNKDLLPDAELYPYVQTQYRSDNTNRVIAQSAPGKGHALGSGHETKKMYGAPAQAEITRLFGNQVGQSGHYKKEMVIDANGQVSVSYSNPAGQVIATALAGENDTNLESLPGESLREINTQLLSTSSNTLDSDRRGKTFIYKFPVTTAGNYDFDYSLDAGTYQINCTDVNNNTQTLELAAVLKIELDLYDGCQTPVYAHSINTTASFATGTATDIDYTISTLPLSIGEYTLVKSLRIDENKLEDYLKEYLTSTSYTCVLKEEDFLADAIADVDFGGCNMSCSDCITRIDNLIAEVEGAYPNNPIIITAEEKATLYERCDDICLDNFTCKGALFGMLAHVSPDGQYGQLRRKNPGLGGMNASVDPDNFGKNMDESNRDFQLDKDDNGEPSIDIDPAIVPEEFDLSFFNDNNAHMPNLYLRETAGLGVEGVSWRKPIGVSLSGYTKDNKRNQVMFNEDISSATYFITDYYDASGEVVYAYLTEDGNGNYLPAVTDVNEVTLANDDVEPNLYKVPIRHLSDVRDFLKHWQGHFANYLVPYHPEFTYLIECSSNQVMNEYKELMVDMLQPSDDPNGNYLIAAPTTGYLVSDVINKDPFFTNTNIDQKYKDALTSKLNSFRDKVDASGNVVGTYTMAEAATMMVNCPNPHASCKNANCESGEFAFDDGDEWAAFRAFYLTERDRMLKEIAKYKSVDGMYYNGCIGTKDYMASSERDFLLKNSPKKKVVTWKPAYSCNSSWWRFWCSRYWSPHVDYIQTINPNQTCADSRAPLFKDAARAFYNATPGVESGEPVGTVCYEVDFDPANNNEPYYLETECNNSIIDQGIVMGNSAAIKAYQSCGLCPKASGLEGFITQLIEAEALDQNVNDFNCFTSTPSLVLGGELTSELAAGSGDFFDWTGTYNSTSQVLTGIVNTPVNDLNIILDFSQTGIDKMSSATDASELFKYMRVANFTVDGTVNNKFYINMYIEHNELIPEYTALASLFTGTTVNNEYGDAIFLYKFTVEGTIDKVSSGGTTAIDLNTCSFDPVCVSTSYGKKILGILNTLTYQNDEIVDGEVVKAYHLNSTASVDLKELTIYDAPTRNLIGITDTDDGVYVDGLDVLSATWSAQSVTTTNLEGKVAYIESSVNKDVEVSIVAEGFGSQIFDNSLDFSKVYKFKNIRPYQACTSGSCESNKFYADAVIIEDENNDGTIEELVHHRVVVTITTKTAGIQDAQQPISTICNDAQ